MADLKLFIDFSATKEFKEINYEMKYAVRQALLATLEYEDFPYDATLSVTFCDNAHIRGLNKQFRNKDKATDVLSFPLYDFDEEDEELFAYGEAVSLGDIVVSIDKAKTQAKEIGNTLIEEVVFLVVHSTLHLLGYDHERSDDDDEAQCTAQREIIEMLKNKD